MGLRVTAFRGSTAWDIAFQGSAGSWVCTDLMRCCGFSKKLAVLREKQAAKQNQLQSDFFRVTMGYLADYTGIHSAISGS